MKSFKSTRLTFYIFFYVLSIAILSFCVVNFFVSQFNVSDAAIGGGIIDPNPDIWDDGGGGGSGSSDWNSLVDNEAIPEAPNEAFRDITGGGTESNPYKIYCQDHFNKFIDKANTRNGAKTTVYGKIMNDFSFNAYSYIDQIRNTYVNTIYEYGKIHLDGNYKRISLNIKVDVSRDNPRTIGLIGSIYQANIRNLKVTGDIIVSGDAVEAVGGLIGCCTYSTIENCYIAPNIEVRLTGSTDRSTYVAGIIGMTAGLNENYASGTLDLTDSVFAGKLDLSKSVKKQHPFYTGGCSLKAQNFYNTNSYYKYQKICVADNIKEMEEYSIKLQTFYNAYLGNRDNSSKNDFIAGDWTGSLIYKYYYSAAPNLKWLVNRNNVNIKEIKYKVNKGNEEYIPATTISYGGDVASVSTNATSITYKDFGLDYTVSCGYSIPAGYELRTYSSSLSGNPILLTITLDCKIEVVLMSPYLKGTTSTLDSSEYFVSTSGSIDADFPDNISYTKSSAQIFSLKKSGNNLHSKIFRILLEPSEPESQVSKYVVEDLKVGSTSSKSLGNGGTLDEYRSNLVLENGKYVLKIYPIVSLKKYDVTIK